jgi:hypothetical protein
MPVSVAIPIKLDDDAPQPTNIHFTTYEKGSEFEEHKNWEVEGRAPVVQVRRIFAPVDGHGLGGEGVDEEEDGDCLPGRRADAEGHLRRGGEKDPGLLSNGGLPEEGVECGVLAEVCNTSLDALAKALVPAIGSWRVAALAHKSLPSEDARIVSVRKNRKLVVLVLPGRLFGKMRNCQPFGNVFRIFGNICSSEFTLKWTELLYFLQRLNKIGVCNFAHRRPVGVGHSFDSVGLSPSK